MANAIAPAGMHIQCIAMRYIKPNKPTYYVCLIKLVLQFYSWNFDILNYKIFTNEFQLSPIRIPIFSSELASSFIDNGAGLVLSSYMVHFNHSIEQRKQIYSCEANSLGVVSCSYNERTNHLCVYRCLLTNRLHGKAAELCNSYKIHGVH